MDPLLAGRIWLFTQRATSTVVCISVYIGVLLYRWVLGSRCHTSPTRPITLPEILHLLINSSTMKLDTTTSKALQASLIAAESGVYSDLLIKCGTDEYYVHKILLCTRSPFFAKACDGPFKEGQNGEIDLPDDDPEAVSAMICYLYRGCYPRVEADAERPQMKRLGEGWNVETYGEETIALQDEYLCLHAKVYAIAEKYQISGLKEMAHRSFSFLVPRTISPHNFAEASEIAYTMTVDSDRGLRDLVVDVLFSKSQFLEDEALKKLLKRLPDLTYDYVMYQHRKKEEKPESNLGDEVAVIQNEINSMTIE